MQLKHDKKKFLIRFFKNYIVYGSAKSLAIFKRVIHLFGILLIPSSSGNSTGVFQFKDLFGLKKLL